MRVFTLRDPAFLSGTQEGGDFEVIYDPDAQAYISRLSGTYSQVELNAINNLVVSLKASNIWPTIDILYLFCMATIEDSLLNLKSNTYTAIRAFSMPWEARKGFTGNPQNSSYINTQFKPITLSDQFSLTSGTLAIYTPTNTSENSYDIGSQGPSGTGDRLLITSRWSTGSFFAGLNSSSLLSSSVATSAGMSAISRTNNQNISFYKNGSLVTTQNVPSVAISSHNIYIGALSDSNIPTGLSTRRYPLACIAGGWDATQHSEFHSAALAALTAFGAN